MKTLGEFEQLILYAVLRLGDDAYGASIHRELEDRANRSVTAGAVYTVLDRLEQQGLVRSEVGEPTPERGGRRKKYYHLERKGAELLHATHEAQQRMARGLSARLLGLLKDTSR